MTQLEYEAKVEELLQNLAQTNTKSLKFHKTAIELINLYKNYNYGTKGNNI